MNVLVLGAGGLAGSAIAKELRANGHTVSGTCRTASPGHDSDPSMLRFDLDEPQSIVPLLEKTRPDTVISCLRGDFDRQLEAHGFLADFMHRHHGMLIYLSTANVFDGDLSRPHYEGDPLCSDSTYGQFKIACEQLLQDRLGRSCIILRPPEIWGRSCPRLRALMQSCQGGDPLRTYENLFVNYATDVQIARWTAFILEHDLRGVFHVGTQDTSGYTEFLDRLSGRLGLPRPGYDVTRNDTQAYQAVLPGRKDIPAALQLSVNDVLTYLSEGFAARHPEKIRPAVN